MAVLETRFAAKGETVDVALGDGTVAATVDDFPIYDPQKTQAAQLTLRRDAVSSP